MSAGEEYDGTILASKYSGPAIDILVDQGDADNFLHQNQLLPASLSEACNKNANLSLEMRLQEGYDHSYFFISTFVSDHIAFHKKHLM